ncbi:MAG: Gfo/Idh/MocA family oxidoreductase [Hespellia sp.]|nr:Gfo/Idh/MocA family oxidoreductase [Hespellia sp.]
MKNKHLRVGVIGVGYVSKNNYLPILAQTEDIEFVGIMAKNYENAVRAGKSFGAQQAVDSIEKLVDLGIDCAFVLTPKQVHAEQVEYLLNHGVDVFCEKPMATSIEDCKKLCELTEKTGRKLMIGFNRRYAPVIAAAKEALNGEAPDVIIAQKNRPQTEYHATLENAVHMVDLMRYFCGEAVDVNAIAKFIDPDYETFTTAQMKFANGSSGILIADRSAGQWEECIEMHGGNRTIIVRMPESITIVDNEQSHTTELTPLAMGWAKSEDKLGFTNAVNHFFECIREDKTPLTSPQDAYKTHVLLNEVLTKAGLPPME